MFFTDLRYLHFFWVIFGDLCSEIGWKLGLGVSLELEEEAVCNFYCHQKISFPKFFHLIFLSSTYQPKSLAVNVSPCICHALFLYEDVAREERSYLILKFLV